MDRAARLEREFDLALDELRSAPGFAKPRYQPRLFGAAAELLDSDRGVRRLLQRSAATEAAGAFHGGPWSDPAALVPALMGPSLVGEGAGPTVEALSTLRLIAVARGEVRVEGLDPAEARRFLEEAAALTIGLALGRETEARRARPKLHRRAQRVLSQVHDEIGRQALLPVVVEELRQLSAQRPIIDRRLRDLVRDARDLCDELDDGPVSSAAREALRGYGEALDGPTARSRRARDVGDYAAIVEALDADELVLESQAFAERTSQYGITSALHAPLLRRLAKLAPERIGDALLADDTGCAEARRHAELVGYLVRSAVVPGTPFAIRGLRHVLDRSLLTRVEVAGGLRKIANVALTSEAESALRQPYLADPGVAPPGAHEALLAGCLALLGLPLGVGQGHNPTCQSARGLSLWSQYAPGLLLAQVVQVARDGYFETNFEGRVLRSDLLVGGLAPGLGAGRVDVDLDPVSRLLVPHIDRVYDAMMNLAGGRGADGHRWVNPALYGRWVPSGFASVFDPLTGAVVEHESFVRRFHATHHPDHNGGHGLLFPNPVGILVTDAHGRLLGRHAVSIQRVERPSPDSGPRVYFFNPNNEGRQDWGLGVRVTVDGHGERPGESSLPFEEFGARLYAFHFDPQEEGDPYAVPMDAVERVLAAARASWLRPTH